MPSYFQYNYAGVGEWMRTDAALAAGVAARAELALAFAKSIAPVGTPPEDEHPGQFRDSLEVRGPYLQGDRLGYELGSDVEYGKAVEARHHVIRATVAAFGDPRGGPGQ